MSSLDALFADNHLLAVNKRAGEPTVPDESGDESLFERARAWVEHAYEKPGRAFLGVVHRLDRPVSGVVLFARTSKAAARLGEQFRSREARKTYLAVCHGWPASDGGELVQWLEKDAARRVVTARTGPGGDAREARTGWRVLARFAQDGERRALLELVPHTGRPHQLRVAASTLGHPLLGDLKYGAPRPLPDKSIALHAAALSVVHPTRRERVELGCPPPDAPWWPASSRSRQLDT